MPSNFSKDYQRKDFYYKAGELRENSVKSASTKLYLDQQGTQAAKSWITSDGKVSRQPEGGENRDYATFPSFQPAIGEKIESWMPAKFVNNVPGVTGQAIVTLNKGESLKGHMAATELFLDPKGIPGTDKNQTLAYQGARMSSREAGTDMLFSFGTDNANLRMTSSAYSHTGSGEKADVVAKQTLPQLPSGYDVKNNNLENVSVGAKTVSYVQLPGGRLGSLIEHNPERLTYSWVLGASKANPTLGLDGTWFKSPKFNFLVLSTKIKMLLLAAPILRIVTEYAAKNCKNISDAHYGRFPQTDVKEDTVIWDKNYIKENKAPEALPKGPDGRSQPVAIETLKPMFFIKGLKTLIRKKCGHRECLFLFIIISIVCCKMGYMNKKGLEVLI